MLQSVPRTKLKTFAKKLASAFPPNIPFENSAISVICMFAAFSLEMQTRCKAKVRSYNEFNRVYSRAINQLNRTFPFFSEAISEGQKSGLLNDRMTEEVSNFLSLMPQTLDNLLSWAYQYMKLELEREIFRKALRHGEKISGKDIRPVTQFSTEDYMVRFLVANTMGKNAGEQDLKSLTVLDPACGGGNFLVAAFESLFNTFVTKGYPRRYVAEALINDVLFGYDVDIALTKVASLNLYIKACSILNEDMNVVGNVYSPLSEHEEIGALRAGADTDVTVNNTWINCQRDYMDIFRKDKFDIVITNPPFMGPRNMGTNLKEYLNLHYPTSKGDLAAAFSIRCLELAKNYGMVAMVNQTGWLFLKSLKDLRLQILNTVHIEALVDLGSNSFFDLNGEKASVCLTVYSKDKAVERKSAFIDLTSVAIDQKSRILSQHGYQPLMRNIIQVDQSLFLKNKGYELDYAATKTHSLNPNTHPQYGDFATPMQGTSTGDNKRFIDYAWNHSDSDKDWITVSKGGGYSKWAGNNIYKVMWGKNANYISQHPGSALRNVQYFDKTDLVYSDTGTLGLNVRLLLPGQIFIASGPGIRLHVGDKYAHMAFLNSRLASYYIKRLSPKLTVAAGYIARLPVIPELFDSHDLSSLGRHCFKCKSEYLSGKLTNSEYTHPDFASITDVREYIRGAIMRDFSLEVMRLESEFGAEALIREAFQIDKRQLDHIYGYTGPCSFELEYKDIGSGNNQELDALIARTLTPNAQYSLGRSRRYVIGTEGPVEELSYAARIAPSAIFKRLELSIDYLTSVKEIYTNDLLHKAVLFYLGWETSGIGDIRPSSVKETAHFILRAMPSIRKVIPHGLTLTEWLYSVFPAMHERVFLGRPVIWLDNDVFTAVQTNMPMVIS